MSDNDKRKNVDEGDKDRSPQVGALLRATRTRLGEDLRDIADVLCIRYLYLEAIEDCRYSDLPGDTYVIGFIRSYAEHMGLDGEEVVRRFRAEQIGNRRSNELLFPTPVPESGMPKGAIVFIGVVLAVLVYGGWYMSTTDEDILSDLISPVPDRLKHLVTGDDAATMTSPDAGASDAAGAEASVVTPTEAAPEATVPQPALPTETPASEATPNAKPEATPEVAAEAQTVTETVTEPAEPLKEKAEAVVEAAPTPETANADTTASEESAVTETVTTAPEPADAATAAAEQMTQTANEIAASMADPAPASAETPAAADTPAVSVTESAVETPATAETAAVSETPQTSETPAPVETPSVTETAETSAPPAKKELTADELNALSLKRVTSGGDNATATETASPPPVPVSAAATTPTNSNVALSGIVIRATNSSWVEIRDPEDKIIFTGLMSAGATYNVPDIDGLLLATGNAGALDITVDGTSVPVLGDIGAVRKGVALSADRLKAGTATAR